MYIFIKGYILKNIIKIIAQASLLWVIYYLSTWVVKFFHIPLPGSVLGMIVLFAMLSAGAIKEQWLTAAAAPMLKHLTFFFIPIAVELMEWGGLFRQKGHLLFLPLVVSTLAALAVTGGIVQLMMKSKHDKKEVN
jgi:holin-like protein